jgi:hypothetical protein
MDILTNEMAEPFSSEDRSGRYTLPVVVNEDTLRPPTPMIEEQSQIPFTWWKENNVGEKYNIFFSFLFTLPKFLICLSFIYF